MDISAKIITGSLPDTKMRSIPGASSDSVLGNKIIDVVKSFIALHVSNFEKGLGKTNKSQAVSSFSLPFVSSPCQVCVRKRFIARMCLQVWRR